MALDLSDKIIIAGHNGMVGSAILRTMKARGFSRLLTAERAELDLMDQRQVHAFLTTERPKAVIVAAAKVGGIVANNSYPAEFLYNNLMIEANLIHNAFKADVERLVFLGSSCIYPKHARQPIEENALLTGALEPTNEPYAIAKIAGIKLCESYNRQYGTDFRSLMPTNLYGPNDNFDLETSHVIPALLAKFHAAKRDTAASVPVWGTGAARREFLHVDDMANATLHFLLLEKAALDSATTPMASHINIGTGIDISIRALAETVKAIVGFDGAIEFDSSRPDGTLLKRLDTRLAEQLGWRASIDFEEGLAQTYRWYEEHHGAGLS